MNVLLAVPWDNLGGVCNVVNAVALHLREAGHGAWLLLPGESDRAEETSSRIGLPAVRLNLRPAHVPGARIKGMAAYAFHLRETRRQLRNVLRERSIDVVNVHFPHDSSQHLVAMREAGLCRLVASIHGADLLPYTKEPPQAQNSVNSVLAISDALVAPSHSFVRAAARTWPILGTRPVHVIPNGVDPAELGYDPHLPWSEAEPPYILSVATLVPYKGVDVIIRAFALMASEFPAVRLKLVSHGPDYANLMQLAGLLGVADRVDFLGALDRPQVASALRGSTLFVLASRSDSESFGIAAAEAMALDRAVIVSNVGALPEMVEHEKTGLLVPPGDAQSLADAMRRGLLDRPLRERLGRAAGHRVRRDYLWSRTGAEYEQLLRRTLGQADTFQSPSPQTFTD